MIGGTNFTSSGSPGNNILTASQNPLGVGNGFNLGYIDGSVSIAGKQLFQIGALVTALRGDGKSNILSTPSILTLDNQEAEIKVAQEVPFLTGQYTTASTTANATTRRRDQQSVPDHRAQGRRPRPQGQAADQRRRFGAPGHPSGSLAPWRRP